MNSQATLERMLIILITLNHNIGRSPKELARVAGGVSTRSIYRYLETITNAGFVIENVGRGCFRLNLEETSPRLRRIVGYLGG